MIDSREWVAVVFIAMAYINGIAVGVALSWIKE